MEPVFIITYNLLSTTQGMVRDILRMNGIPVILDNKSTYPPLVDWLNGLGNSKELLCVRLDNNYGPRVAHELFTNRNMQGIFDKIKEDIKERFHVTIPECPMISDGDLDLSEIPEDGLKVLRRMQQFNRATVRRYKKIGFSLKIDDLPTHPMLHRTRMWERQFYSEPKEFAGYPAHLDVLLDTTFHVFDPTIRGYSFFGPAIRTARPYTARHVPWYWLPGNVDSEATYYLQNLQHLDKVSHSRDVKYACAF